MRPSLLLLSLTLACSSAPSKDGITFDACQALALRPGVGASPDEIASLSAAIEMWNRLGETQLAVGEVEAAAITVEFQEAAAPFHGYYDPATGTIYINHDLADPHARAVTLAHEVGHALGLVHISADERSSVMNPGNLTVEPTPEDRGALEAIWGACPTSP